MCICVDQGSLSTNLKIGFTKTSSNAEVSTAGLQSSSGYTSHFVVGRKRTPTAGLQFSSGHASHDEDCSPVVETSAFVEMLAFGFCESNFLVGRKRNLTCVFFEICVSGLG